MTFALRILAIALLLVSASANAQIAKPRFQYLTSADGLSQNSINDMYQDEWGYLWIATQDGLNRYDGYDFVTYRPDANDPWSISDNFITRIVPDSIGNMWVLGRYGLNYYERSSDRFYKFFLDSELDVTVPINIINIGDEWIATFLWEAHFLPKNPIEASDIINSPFDLSDSLMHVIELDGVRLVGEVGSLYLVRDDASFETLLLHENQLTQYQGLWSRDNQIFYVVAHEVFEYEVESKKLKLIFREPTQASIQDIEPRVDGSLWIAHTRGLTILQNGETRNIISEPDRPGGLSYPLVHSLFEDRDGTMWVGTANGGLNYESAGAKRFTHISDVDGLSHNQVWCGYQDTKGRLWVGAEKGLNCVVGNKVIEEYDEFTSQFDDIRITAITEDKLGQLWIGTSRNALFRADKNLNVQRIDLEGSNKFFQSVSCLQEDGDYMWIGTLGKLNRAGLKDNHAFLFDKNAHPDFDNVHYVLSLLNDKDRLYIGASAPLFVMDKSDSSLVEFKFKANSKENQPSFQFGTGIELGVDGTVWLSTFGGGLNAFNPITKTFKEYSIEEGLENAVLAAMKSDGDELWLSHNSGLSRFNAVEKSFVNFGMADGLPFSEFSMGGGCCLNDGRMFFGGTEGFVLFHPNEFSNFDFDAEPLITDLSINYEPQLITSNLSNIEVNPEDRVFSLRFAAVDFIHSDRFKYEYMLDGFDKTWVQSPISERRATYSNLPFGDYNFRVRVADQNGSWSSKELILPIKVIPPLWMRWWFILINAIWILLLIVFVVRYFAQLKIKRQLRDLEMQQRVHRERERISMDLHDHVGAQISYLISNLDRLGLEHRGEEGTITGLGKYAREAMRELRDTVWAIRQDSMSIRELSQRTGKFASDLFEESSVGFEIVSEGAEERQLEPAQALHVLRILQEALHNIYKHAEAQRVSVTLSATQAELIIHISDDGKGFSEETIEGDEHNGLRNMRDRASEIGALFVVNSNVGEGTSIRITLPLKNKAIAPSTDNPSST